LGSEASSSSIVARFSWIELGFGNGLRAMFMVGVGLGACLCQRGSGTSSVTPKKLNTGARFRTIILFYLKIK
jgi:hypothetical protein